MTTGSIFAWSDTHIGHVRLAEAWRPWAGGSVAAHNEHIREVHNSVVRPNDEIIYLGDVCMGVLTESLEFFKTLHGVKFLIPGNHDRMHDSYREKSEKKARWRAMYEEIFTIMPQTVVRDQFVMCHFPWFGTEDKEGREQADLIDLYGPDMGEFHDMVLLHGHTHAQERTGERSIHVGVDAWPEGPVSFDDIQALASFQGWI